MDGEVGEPQSRVVLAREGSRHPAVRVIEVPDGDAHAPLDLDAGGDDLGRD